MRSVPLSLRQREKTGTNLNLHAIGPLSLREREKTGTNLNLHAIGPLSLRERVRVRVVFKH
jgi:hypothetical protein